MSKSLLPVPVFHDDHLSHSFKHANDSFRQRQRPPKLYPKHNPNHHHQHQHNHGQLQPLSQHCSATAMAVAQSQPPSGQLSSSSSHQQQHDSVFNKSMSCSSVATSVSFTHSLATNNNDAGPAYAGTAPVVVVTQRPLTSPHYRPDRRETYFEQCFVVLARLGEGSFSEVFRVRSRDDGHEYAVKRSKQPYKSERYREERLEEVRRYEQLARNEHCLRLYIAWEQDDHLYMQLELCRESVDTFVLRQRRPLVEAQVWPILADMLLGIKALHDRNLIHLDVKLENIMMDGRGVCKLGDFGLVVDLSKPNLHQSCEGDSRYIAPELMQSQFTKAADVFSFGITALELVCNLALPNNGPLWVQLRNGELPACLDAASADMQQLIRAAMRPEFRERPGVDELLGAGQVQRVLRRRRRWQPVRRVAVEMPRMVLRCARRTLQVVRAKLCGLLVRVLALFSLSGAGKEGGTGIAGGRQPPNTPRHGHYATVAATPHQYYAGTPSASPMLQMRGAATSTPSWRSTAGDGGSTAAAHDDGDFVFGRSPRLGSLIKMTPEMAAAQLLQLDDSEIEGSPRAKGTTMAMATSTTPCGTSAAAMLANSTPLTRHLHVGGGGGFRKSRRDTSVPSLQ